MSDGGTITAAHLELPGAGATAPPTDDPDAAEAARLRAALRAARWNVSEVSRKLGIPRNTLYRKLKYHHRLGTKEPVARRSGRSSFVA